MIARMSASSEPIPVNGAPLVLLSHLGLMCSMCPPPFECLAGCCLAAAPAKANRSTWIHTYHYRSTTTTNRLRSNALRDLRGRRLDSTGRAVGHRTDGRAV